MRPHQVLLLHGWPGDRTDFSDVAERLDADITMPDLRGFGESDKHPNGDYSPAGQARSIIGLMDELGIQRAVLAGYDIGSRLAQVVAHQHPNRVAELVLAPPLPGIGRRVLEPQQQLEFWYQAFHQLDLAEQLVDGRPDAVRTYLRHFWNHWSGPHYTPSDARIEHLTHRYSAPGAFMASIGWYRSGAATVARSLQETPPAERITTPTTVLWPEFDPLFPPEWSDGSTNGSPPSRCTTSTLSATTARSKQPTPSRRRSGLRFSASPRERTRVVAGS